MVKAKDFLNHLCNNLGYRFFSGVPVAGFKAIFGNMNPDIMHYVPAANEQIALNMAAGVSLSGMKSVVMVSADSVLFDLDFDFNTLYNIPLIVLVTSDVKPVLLGRYMHNLDLTDNYTKDLDLLSEYVESEQRVATMYFEDWRIV